MNESLKLAPQYVVVFGVLFGVFGVFTLLALFAGTPNSINLSSESINENVPANSVVGALTATSAGGSGQFSNPYDYKVIPNFDPNVNLPSAKSREAYDNWWAAYNSPDDYYQDPPAILMALGDLSTPSHGTYSYARAGGYYLQGLADFIRSTGDPAALNELIGWSQQLKSNLRDHDGRGYPFFAYMNQCFNCGYNKPYDPKFENSDTNFLDEQMLAGNIALIALTMHHNRDYSAAAGVEADFWFDYLANNWVPKWKARSTVNKPDAYTPPAALGLENVLHWDHPTNPRHDDTQPGFYALNPKWTPAYDDGSGPNHLFPVRVFGHPYLMSTFQYYAMAEYFSSGTGTATSRAFPVSDFAQEAQTRNDWWYQQTTPRADGSRDWWLNMHTSAAGLFTFSYSQHVNTFLNSMHWNEYGTFANEAEMESYADTWYHPDAQAQTGKNDVYNAGNTNIMKQKADGTGSNMDFVMRTSALLGCWDETGVILDLNDTAVAGGPTSHKIRGSTRWNDPIHYAAITSCELKAAYDDGHISGPSTPDTYTFTLVGGPGSNDNAKFRIGGTTNDRLIIQESPDFERQSSYRVRVQVRNQDNQTFQQAFTINVNDIDEPVDPPDDPPPDPNDPPPPITGSCDLNFTGIGTGGGTESTYDPAFGPTKLHDGSRSTDSRWSRQGEGAYVDLDLGSRHNLGGMRAAFFRGNTRINSFEVMVSDDGQNFTLVSNNGEGFYASSGTTANFEDFGWHEVEARYIRYVGYGAANGDAPSEWNSVLEIQLCGNELEGEDEGGGEEEVTPDLNNDSRVDILDASLLLSSWGTNTPSRDFNNDGRVDIIDLSILLQQWSGQ